MSYPNLLIVGATKGGTTSVFRYLADHPEVCASSLKEINYFFRFRGDAAAENLKEYESCYRHCNSRQRIRLEASPAYLSGGEWIARKLYDLVPDARFVFILREPVSRYVSHFKFWLAKTNNVPDGVGPADAIRQGLSEPIDMAERAKNMSWEARATQLVRAGCYARALSGYLEVIPAEQICVLFFEDLVRDPQAFMRRICEFADLDSAMYDDYVFSTENKTRMVRFKGLHRLTIGANNTLQPLLNRMPAIRKATRSIYYSLNREIDSDEIVSITESDLSPLSDFYAAENRDLKTLLSGNFPNLELIDWVKEA